jgi:hypothetical protein
MRLRRRQQLGPCAACTSRTPTMILTPARVRTQPRRASHAGIITVTKAEERAVPEEKALPERKARKPDGADGAEHKGLPDRLALVRGVSEPSKVRARPAVGLPIRALKCAWAYGVRAGPPLVQRACFPVSARAR